MPHYVYALHDFAPEHEDEVSFKAGERIEVLEKDDQFNDGWWQVSQFSNVWRSLWPAPCSPLPTTSSFGLPGLCRAAAQTSAVLDKSDRGAMADWTLRPCGSPFALVDPVTLHILSTNCVRKAVVAHIAVLHSQSLFYCTLSG